MKITNNFDGRRKKDELDGKPADNSRGISGYFRSNGMSGLSTNEFVRKIKLKNAERLLLEGKYSISEVAFMVGMNSVVYFRACFKEEYGLAPSHYLKHLKS